MLSPGVDNETGIHMMLQLPGMVAHQDDDESGQ